MQKGYTKLIINHEKTKIINSIGMSILIEIIDLLKERGGVLNVCGLTPTYQRTFKMMRFADHALNFNRQEALGHVVKRT